MNRDERLRAGKKLFDGENRLQMHQSSAGLLRKTQETGCITIENLFPKITIVRIVEFSLINKMFCKPIHNIVLFCGLQSAKKQFT